LRREEEKEEVKEKEKVQEKGEGDAEARLYTSIREIETVFFIIPESKLQKRTRDSDQHTSLVFTFFCLPGKHLARNDFSHTF